MQALCQFNCFPTWHPKNVVYPFQIHATFSNLITNPPFQVAIPPFFKLLLYLFLSLCAQATTCSITIINVSVSVNIKSLNWFTKVTCSIFCTVPFDTLFIKFKRESCFHLKVHKIPASLQMPPMLNKHSIFALCIQSTQTFSPLGLYFAHYVKSCTQTPFTFDVDWGTICPIRSNQSVQAILSWK